MKKYIRRFVDGFVLGVSILFMGGLIGILSSTIFLALVLVVHERGPYIITALVLLGIPISFGVIELCKTNSRH